MKILSLIISFFFMVNPVLAQQSIQKLNVTSELKLPAETASRVLILNAQGKATSSIGVTDTELEHISTLGSNAQTQLDGKVNTTGNESISGVKTFTGKVVSSSTTNGAHPCPSMTDAQMLAIAAPANGDCVHNTTLETWMSYNSTDLVWGEMGGGGGISNWVTAEDYEIGDVVIESLKIYQANTGHTSGTFASEIANWTQIANNVGDAAGILAMANGGSAKALVASNGAIAYSDTNSLELLSPGSAGQILQTNGVAAPTFVNKSISGKAQELTAITLEQVQVPNKQLTETGTNTYLIDNCGASSNQLQNCGFEHTASVTGWTHSAGSSATESTNVKFGKQALKITLAAEILDLGQTSTLNATALADGADGVSSIHVRTSVANIYFCREQAGVLIAHTDGTKITDCVEIPSNNAWFEAVIPTVLGGTSNGVRIVSLTPTTAAAVAVTGVVTIDEAKLAVGSLAGFSNDSSIAGESYIAGTALCSLSRTSTTIGALTDDADCPGPTIVGTPRIGTWATTDANNIIQTVSNLKSGDYEATWCVNTGGNTSNRTIMAVTDGVTTSPGYATMDVGSGGGAYTGACATGFFYNISGTKAFQLVGASTPDDTWNVANTAGVTGAQGATFRLKYIGSGKSYLANCGANCVDSFSADISVTGVKSKENITWLAAGPFAPSTSVFTLTVATGISTLPMSCTCSNTSVDYDDVGCSAQVTSNTSISVTTSQDSLAADFPFAIKCDKVGADFVATRQIIGSFKEMDHSPGVSKPKTCHLAWGGVAATLISPTECTTGTCIEVVDTCAAVTPPAWTSTGFYDNITFASGTFANSSLVTCDCLAYDTTTGTARKCELYWVTSENSWASNASGGMVLNAYANDQTGVAGNTYNQVTCKGQAP